MQILVLRWELCRWPSSPLHYDEKASGKAKQKSQKRRVSTSEICIIAWSLFVKSSELRAKQNVTNYTLQWREDCRKRSTCSRSVCVCVCQSVCECVLVGAVGGRLLNRLNGILNNLHLTCATWKPNKQRLATCHHATARPALLSVALCLPRHRCWLAIKPSGNLSSC